MSSVLSEEVARFVRAAGPDPDETLVEMDEFAEREGFPHVGPDVGSVLRLIARMTDAERVFEFGSGYGYSAYWFAQALPEDGEVVLTEVDEDELEMAREYMAEGGHDDLARYELGDALETVERYEGPFDVVLIDHQKERYADAFEAVKPKVPVGGAIVADNAMRAGPLEFETLLSVLESGDDRERTTLLEGTNDMTRGVAEYLRAVRRDDDFETIVLPIGEGIALSYRVR